MMKTSMQVAAAVALTDPVAMWPTPKLTALAPHDLATEDRNA